MATTFDAKWADGEPDLRGWIVIGPFYEPTRDVLAILVEDDVDGTRRAIYFDKQVRAMRSFAVEE